MATYREVAEPAPSRVIYRETRYIPATPLTPAPLVPVTLQPRAVRSTTVVEETTTIRERTSYLADPIVVKKKHCCLKHW